MNMIELKQTQLNQLEKSIFQKALKTYSDGHKVIYNLEKELNFLKEIELTFDIILEEQKEFFSSYLQKINNLILYTPKNSNMMKFYNHKIH